MFYLCAYNIHHVHKTYIHTNTSSYCAFSAFVVKYWRENEKVYTSRESTEM